ncbi:MAG: Phenylacetate-coenzyme A ligase [Spirochaetes bacterium ADurb.Bin218]|jgi:phenylacetate-CoA ligase|nr:phenylacetate--CoA ligase [Spirochaetota bacterium]OQA99491.1 MAG: Phenylacetate-coenzyme A ligase [Spirochaetes bacterium ADurb.Bin218]
MFNKEIETMPEKKMKELQLERLKWSVRHAYDNVPFYKKKFDEAGFHPDQLKSLDDMRRIPFLTKQDMRDHYPYGLFAVPLSKVVRVHASSGTTGNATVVGYTKNDIEVFSEVVARSLASYGVTEKDIIQVAYGYGLFTGGLGLHYGSEKLGALTVPISGGNTPRQLMLIKDFGTTVIACTPSYALNIADYIEKNMPDFKIEETRLRIGVFGAEPWTEAMRQEIEKRLKIDAYDIYGLSEVIGPGVSCECSEKSGLHVFEDHFYVEIIDPETGEVLPEGEKGEIVYTSLTKEAFPGIRYRSRDITRLYHDSCKCGRTLVKMEKVTGRSDDMLIIRGVNVFPSQVEAVLMEVPGIEPHYQIIVDRKGSMDDIEVMVEVNEKVFSDEIKVLNNLTKHITDRFRSILGISAKITLVEPQTIPRSEGKAVRVIDRRKLS